MLEEGKKKETRKCINRWRQTLKYKDLGDPEHIRTYGPEQGTSRYEGVSLAGHGIVQEGQVGWEFGGPRYVDSSSDRDS